MQRSSYVGMWPELFFAIKQMIKACSKTTRTQETLSAIFLSCLSLGKGK